MNGHFRQKKTGSIVFEIVKDGKSRIGTGITLHPDLWDKEKQRPTRNQSSIRKHEKENPALRAILESIETKQTAIRRMLADYERETAAAGEVATHECAASYIRVKLNPEKFIDVKTEFLTDYLKNTFIPGIRSGEILPMGKTSAYGKTTIKNKLQTLSALERFEKKYRRIRWAEIGPNLHSELLTWANRKNFSVNYTGRIIKDIKAIARQAYRQGVHSQIIQPGSFPEISESVFAIALTLDELEKLRALKLTGTREVVRDVFLIGCYTAQRFSDYSKYKPEHLKRDGNGQTYIEVYPQKTRGHKTRVSMPLHPIAEQIMSTPGYFARKIPSEQRTNDMIKELAKLAGISGTEEILKSKVKGHTYIVKKERWELVTTHTARRTGATLMYKAGIPFDAIMKYTGHKTEINLRKYLKITNEEANAMLINSEFFNSKPKLRRV